MLHCLSISYLSLHLLALVFIDAEHMILPNVITYPGIVFALVARVAIPYLTGHDHTSTICRRC